MPMTDDRDRAAGKGGMELHQLERLLSDMEKEPDWRPSANKCADYYDHKQADAERVQRSKDTGEPLVIMNLIQRTINGALGMEAKTRLSWKVEPDAAVFADMAAVLGHKLHEAQREARTDLAISEAYASMLKTGIGWVEVSRSPDPLAYPYRVVPVHRNEVWWDWRARESDKQDARWMCRQRWVDLDEAQAALPKFRDLLEIGCHSGPITDSMARTILTTRDQFESIHSTRRSFSRTEEEWLDNAHGSRKRVRFYSVYYKEPKEEVALVSGTKRVKFNPKNPVHQAAVQMGAAKILKGPSYEIRHAMFAGPYRLFDTALTVRKFPLVPFVCYSCDDDRSPYGLVHGMISPQDEYNKRRSRLLWLLEAKQVFVDNDALDTRYNNFVDLAREVMRPDAMFVLNGNRRNADGLRVITNQPMQKEQADVMLNAQQLIQEIPGVYNALLGQGKDGASSGVALQSLVEQSVTSLGETSDNYRTGRALVGDVLLGLIADDLSDPNIVEEVGSGTRRRKVTLNTVNEQGLPMNVVEDSAVRVGLGDIPTTQAYRAQTQLQISNALQVVGQDPMARAVLLPALLETSDLEHGKLYAKWLRSKMGVPDPEAMDEQGLMQSQQAEAQAQAEQAAMAKAMAEAEVQKTNAEAALTVAKTETEMAKTGQVRAQADQTQLATMQQAMNPQMQQPAANEEDALIADALAEAGG